MAHNELKTDQAPQKESDESDVPRQIATGDTTKYALTRILAILITMLSAVLAVPLGWAMWNAYMETPWTRDGVVRAHVITMAPEVAGQIVDLPVVDNQFVHKGDLLMEIDPTNYII